MKRLKKENVDAFDVIYEKIWKLKFAINDCTNNWKVQLMKLLNEVKIRVQKTKIWLNKMTKIELKKGRQNNKSMWCARRHW